MVVSFFFRIFVPKTSTKKINDHIVLTKIRIIKYALVAFALVIIMAGCQSSGHKTAQNDSSVLEDSFMLTPTADTLSSEMSVEVQQGIVLEKVKDIYRLIRAEYMAHGGSFDNEMFDRTFCSKSWNKLMMKVHRKEDRTGTLFFEINHWSMSRAAGNFLFFDEFEVKYFNTHRKDKRAVVSFTVFEDYTFTPARVELVYEDNQWKIDNFYNLRYGLNVRTAMWNYIHRPYII